MIGSVYLLAAALGPVPGPAPTREWRPEPSDKPPRQWGYEARAVRDPVPAELRAPCPKCKAAAGQKCDRSVFKIVGRRTVHGARVKGVSDGG